MPRINISFDDSLKKTSDYCDVKITNNKGIEMDQFRMSLDEVIISIVDSTFLEIEEDIHYRTTSPILPKNCLSYGQTISSKTGKRTEHFLIDVPKQQWDIYIYNTMFLEVGFPRMLFSYSMSLDKKQTKQLESISVFALKDGEIIQSNTKIYKFPFSNVDQSGVLCLGYNSKPKISNYDELTELHNNFFFHTPFTSDYYSAERVNSDIPFESVRELAMHLSENPFPDEWLQPTNIVFRDLIINK